MKRKFISIFIASVLALSLCLVTAVPAGAAYDDYTNAITKTADRLVALQGTDGGWDWDVTDLTEHSGVIPSSFNLYGVTALGLIDAHEITSKTAYFNAATKTANHLKGLSRATDPDVRIMTFDYRFLVEFSALSGDPSYKEHALSEWNWVKANVASFYADGNQENIYTFWVDHATSYGYAAWQAADCGLATLAMGDTSYASNMATVLAGHLTEIAVDDMYRFIGWGYALEFLNAVDSTAYATEISSLITNLIGSQDPNGSWGTGENPEGYAQDTAYAIMGLAVAGGAEAIAAAEAGADWLIESQDDTGGWIHLTGEPPVLTEYSESDSEALQAIKAVLDISGAVSMTATYIPLRPQIGISVTPASVSFGDVEPDIPSVAQMVTVTNTGTVAEKFSTSIINESHAPVYADGLVITWSPEPPSNVAVDTTADASLVLTVPINTAPGTYTATLVFWAEAAGE